MRKITLLLLGTLCLPIFARDVVIDHDPFIPFEKVPKELLMPQNSTVSLDKYGNYLINGKVRYMPGISNSGNNFDQNAKRTEGYPESLYWFYEDVLTYDAAQRIGFDTLVVSSPAVWLRKLDPNAPVEGQNEKNWALTRRMLTNRLPVILDCTMFPWDHGALGTRKKLAYLRKRFPAEAFNTFSHNNHWMPYNIFHPEARKIWQMVWENGFDEMKKHGGTQVFACELFNEPAYNEPSEYNKKLFSKHLEKKFKTVETMNKAFRYNFKSFDEAASLEKLSVCVPLNVAWGRFQEDGFTDLCKFGAQVVRQKQPGAFSCTQVLGGSYFRNVANSNVNIFDISRHMDIICLPTSGGLTGTPTAVTKSPAQTVRAAAIPGNLTEGVFLRHFFRGMADGKPIHNPETYAPKDKSGIVRTMWLDLLRGSSITYFFSWYRGYNQWLPAKVPEGGRKLALQMSYLLRNPYGYNPELLTGFYAAKKEIFSLADFFVSRKRFSDFSRQAAILFSFPTERYGFYDGYGKKEEIMNYTGALEFGHFLPDVLFEEQLPEKRADKYQFLILPGVRNIYAETLPALEKFVRNGGILIVGRELPRMDEYGNPVSSPLFAGISAQTQNGSSQKILFSKDFRSDGRLRGDVYGVNDWEVTASADWQCLANAGSSPALLKKAFGKGFVYVIAPMMQDYAVAAVLGGIFSAHGKDPVVELRRYPENDLALHMEVHPGKSGTLTGYYMQNHDRYPKLMKFKTNASVLDIRNKTILPRKGDGVLLTVNSTDAVLLAEGSRAELEKRFGMLRDMTEKELRQAYEKIFQKHQEQLARQKQQEFSFEADSSALVTIDLRRFANRSFIDSRPGDGKGGWTDQGRDGSLEDVPWDTRSFCGIPCDLIRYDSNGDRSCIMLNSKSLKEKLPAEVTGIPVNQKVKNLYFFHTSAWSELVPPGTEVMSYKLRYADGTVVSVPICNRIEIGNWWDVKKPQSPTAYPAWKNRKKRGFYVYGWENPHPEKTLQSIDIVSSNTPVITAVVAVSAELAIQNQTVKDFNMQKVRSWGNTKIQRTGDNRFELQISTKTKEWSGCSVEIKDKLVLTPEIVKSGKLVFKFKGGKDAFGNPLESMTGTVNVFLYGISGKGNSIKLRIPSPKPNGQVSIPLTRLFKEKLPFHQVGGMAFQYFGKAFAGFHVEEPQIIY